MRPVRVTVVDVAVSPPIPCDQYLTPFNLGLGVKMVGGATYKVQHTFDDVFDPAFTPAAATWYDHTSLAGLSADADGNYAFPVSAVRLNVTAADSAAEGATLTVLQAGVR